MAIKIRRGTDTERLTVVLEEGEIAYTTDTKKFYIGDGTTTGGNEIPAGFTPPDGLLQTALELSNTLQSIQDQNSNTSALQIGTDNIGLAADTTATTQTTAVIQATDTNSGIAIVPNGTGAFTLDVPTGNPTGGDARGQYAVDLQRYRNSSTQIAGGDYSFIAGRNNSTKYAGTFAIGYNNIVTGAANSGAIGWENSVSKLYSICFGANNTVSSERSTISGGQFNTASTNTHATVVGGYQNSSTGQYSVSGGYSNVASGLGSVALGYDNTASNTASITLGQGNNASGRRSIAMGLNSTASGEVSTAIGNNAVANLSNAVAIGYQVTSLYADGTTVKNFAISNYASLNFADDSAAATGGVPIGGVYHTLGVLKIRLT